MKIEQIELLSARPGDFLWIQLASDVSDADAEEFQHNLFAELPMDVISVVTTDDLVQSVRNLNFQELILLREQVDHAINLFTEQNSIDE